jgi:parallel beta-helix repeat protein
VILITIEIDYYKQISGVNMLFKKITFMLVVIIAAAGINLAATYYVDANSGNDANSGTSTSSAWKTISKVNVNSFTPGDNILFLRGCTWIGTLNFNYSGTSTSPIVYGSYGAGVLPIIDANNANAAGIIQSKNYITVQEIKFQNAAASPGGTMRVSNAMGIRVQNCEIYLTTQGSVFIQNSSNCFVSNNIVTTPTFLNVQTDGIYSQRNANNTYEGNRIVISNTETTNHDDCIQSYLDTSLTIRNNYLEQQNSKLQNAQGIYMTDGAGTFTIYNNVVKCPNNQANIIGFDNDVTGTGSLVLYNNSVIGGGGNTLRIPHTATVTVKNNIFITTYASTLIQIEATLGAGSVFDNNLYYRQDGNSSIIYYSGSKTITQWKALGFDAHGLNANPMVNDSLYPASNSPCVDHGVDLCTIFNYDKEGTVRPQLSAEDIGAYEFKGTATGVGDNNPTSVVNNYDLAQNYPNPFNPSTVIKYSIGEATHVTIKVYDITGRMVRELVNEDKTAGQFTVDFKANNLASGTYIYSIIAGNFTKTSKMLLLK